MSAPRRSLVSLWLTLGFVGGLAFGWAAFRSETPRATPTAAKPPLPAPARDDTVNAGTLRAVEQTFQRWGGYAVWENDVTELAVWDARRKRHSDFYEVRRHDGNFFFRSLRALTRPIIDHGVNATLPIAFTEPQWMRDEFYREHPDYDPATAPRVDLPLRPPEPQATAPLRPAPPASSPALLDSTDALPPTHREYRSLTPGAGG